ncbi:Arginine N-succinyltransferase [Klebsiella pneumoniae]|uniref:Arginine N-succinyltransferase n=1 Tax=Klebsiella pneumoniae TaxID=573 RepID=A0A4P0Y5B8_KLEPN|nr:Arginine N-succinyltransferase [Klebsiella pneumoniae]
MLFRPVRENDLDDIVRLAARAGVGMTSLPHDVGRLAARIRRSIETFAGELPRSQQGFLFGAGGHRAGAGGGGERH